MGRRPLREKLSNNYPLIRNYCEKISLRITFHNFYEGFCALQIPRNKDAFKELRVKFVIFVIIIISASFFDGNNFVSEGNVAQKWVKYGFLSLAGSGPEVAPKWVSGPFSAQNRPRNHFAPTFGPLSANNEKPILGPLLCHINCLTILVSVAMPAEPRSEKIFYFL